MPIDILLFAKAPIAGFVKTRLIPLLGEALATQVYQTLLGKTITEAMSVKDARLICWVAPDDQHPYFTEFDMLIKTQVKGDLGQRMLAAADASWQQGHAVILIGADCPLMTQAYLEQAVCALASQDAVMGASDDGGYVLLGLTHPVPSLFENMPWSSDKVSQITCDRMDKLGLQWSSLPVLWDLDEDSDWERYQLLDLT